MGNLFGVRRRVPIVTAQDRAILQLKQQRDKIKIYQKKTEIDLLKNKDLALKLFQNGMKDRALIVLRRKKCMEETLSRTDKQLETLEQLVNDIEYTQIEISVVEGLKVGTEALKQLNSLMNIDDIQSMMEDNEEASEKQREISEILHRSSIRYDEDDLLKELDTYIVDKQPQSTGKLPSETDTTIDSKLRDLPTVPDESKLDNLPEVPKEEPKEKERVEQESDAARQLVAETM